jgi:hypothetical protein
MSTALLGNRINKDKTILNLLKILDSHSGCYKKLYFLGYNSVKSVESKQTFWRNMWNPNSGWNNEKQ